MGVDAKSFIRSVRVARARELLQDTDLTTAQVMQRSGFASTDAGRRAFVSLEGVSPARYRGR
jgi:transcriptional regulator GlxA family with amidase domain